jgi:acyl-CoA synthetase (AMP-forming)/AMP-acid ligase II
VPSVDALRAFCRARLAGFKLPLRFHWVEALPCTATGKLQRQRLLEPQE